MKGDSAFLVEDFINAITSQLDRVQDVLRMKAQVRPLTYALKDLALELQVFVDMDGEGNVRFRTSAPNETGASTVRLAFTTITKPMIEENTISLAMTRSPLLDELGLEAEERRRLEQLGVRNAAQLQRLGNTTGSATVARLSGISVERLQKALNLTRPKVTAVRPEKPPTPAQSPKPQPPKPQPPKPPKPPVVQPPPKSPVTQPPVVRPPQPAQPAPPPRPAPPVVTTPPRPAPKPRPAPPFTHQPAPPPRPAPAPRPAPRAQPAPPPRKRPFDVQGLSVAEPDIRVAPGTRRLHLTGSNLVGEDGPPEVRLNNRQLNVSEADEDRLVVEMPDDAESGALEVLLPGGQQLTYSLSLEPEAGDAYGPADEAYGSSEEAYGLAEESYGFAEEGHRERDLWEPERGDF